MTPKERKDLIFRKSRPLARRLEIMEGEHYSKDVGILWAAYQAGSFSLPEGLTQDQFMGEIDKTMNGFHSLWVIDDDSKAYSSGRGPVAIVGANSSGLIVEPKFMFFKWANCRNVIKSIVAFINMIKSSLRTGIVLVRTDRKNKSIADHMKKYDLLFFIGKSSENEYLYTIRGRGSAG